jgi:predicted esterase YcpF (UPF0227 family)
MKKTNRSPEQKTDIQHSIKDVYIKTGCSSHDNRTVEISSPSSQDNESEALKRSGTSFSINEASNNTPLITNNLLTQQLPKTTQVTGQVSDTERLFLATASYPASPVTEVMGNTGEWEVIDAPHEKKSGLEIYAMKKPGSSEVVFVIRGSDFLPDAKSDWGVHGANLSLTGEYGLHPQIKEAILFVNEFMHKHNQDSYTYSVAGHSKGGAFAQIVSHVFGIPGTAVAPAPGGAVIKSEALHDFLADHDIVPKGMPEHSFTNYIETGDLVSSLENIKLDPKYLYFVPLLNQGMIGLDIARIVLGEDVIPKLPHVDMEHHGDKIYVDLEPGKAWTRPFSSLDQHSPLDDTLALATEGPSYILGTQIRECEESLEKLDTARKQMEQDWHGDEVTESILGKIDRASSLLHEKISSLKEMRIHKLEEEYGHVDSWMKDLDFHVKNPQPEILHTLKEIYQKGEDNLVDTNIYLAGKEYESLLEKQKELIEKKQNLENLAHQSFASSITDKIAAGLDDIDRQLREVSDSLEKSRDTQLDFLKQKVGEYTDSWMQSDEFLQTFMQNHQELEKLSTEQIEKAKDPKTLEGVQKQLDEVLDTLHQADRPSSTNPPELSETELHALDNWFDNTHSYQVGTSLFTILPNGEIIKSPLVTSTEEAGRGYEVINKENLPPTREALLQQLIESGCPEEQAQEIATVSDLPAGEDPVAEETGYMPGYESFLGLTKEEWDGFSAPFKRVEEIEGVGNNIKELINSWQTGNDWDRFDSTVDLVGRLEKISDPYFDHEYSEEIQGTVSLVNSIDDIIRLQKAIENGDEWEIAASSTELIDDSISTYNQFSDTPTGTGSYSGAAVSVVSLAVNIKNMIDAYENGDDIEKIKATLNTAQSAIVAYSAAYSLAYGSAGALGSSLPAVGCAIGVAMGLLTMADGNIEGGAEQIALSVATYALSCCGPWGMAAALALQLGSATRGCDGRIIDRENIINFTDDIAPGGGLFAEKTMEALEKSAEVLTKAYEGSSYLSGFNVEMFDDIGVKISEDMHAEFKLAQTAIESVNPLRPTEYFQDLEKMSLADIWDSTYISQIIVATVDQIRHHPDFIKSSFKDTPRIAGEFVKSLTNIHNLGTVINNLLGKESPPEARAVFSLDENGNIISTIGGDSGMKKAVEGWVEPVKRIMKSYRDNGGRLDIHGNLPVLQIIQDEGTRINYHSESGKVSVIVKDRSRTMEKLMGVLYGRDRGERLNSAVKAARNIHGDIDVTKVNAAMAKYGFVKRGLSYTHGEIKEAIGYSHGTGLFAGGGNMGPQGTTFRANTKKISSLPLRPDQLPGRTMGKIVRTLSLNTLFAGPGSEMLAMALAAPGGLPGLASRTAFGTAAESTAHKPLNINELENLLTGPDLQNDENRDTQDRQTGAAETFSHNNEIPRLDNPEELQNYLESHWTELLKEYGLSSELDADRTYFFREEQGAVNENTFMPVETGNPPNPTDSIDMLNPSPTVIKDNISYSGPITEHKNIHGPAENNPDTPVPSGPVFTMPEDSSLRFLISDLLHEAVPAKYGRLEDSPVFLSFGAARHGRIIRDDNGDIRFQADPDFTGTASFSYSLLDSSGNLVEKEARVIVGEVNDPPLPADDEFTLNEGERFFLEKLLTNDTDPEGDILKIDHLRDLDHGRIIREDGHLFFHPEAGFTGDIVFSYWVRDHASSYPVMGSSILHYVDKNLAPTAREDRFLIMEENELNTTVARLLANDTEFD